MKLELKISPSQKYCAVKTEGYLWADFYWLEIRTDFLEEVSKGLISPYKAQCLFTKRRNTYYTYGTKYLLEFAEENDETYFIFNSHHGYIEIFNMKGEKILDHDLGDVFFYNYFLSETKKDLILNVWNWHPIEAVIYFDLKKLFNDSNYNGVELPDSYESKFEKWIDQSNCVFQLTNGNQYSKSECILKVTNDNQDQ